MPYPDNPRIFLKGGELTYGVEWLQQIIPKCAKSEAQVEKIIEQETKGCPELETVDRQREISESIWCCMQLDYPNAMRLEELAEHDIASALGALFAFPHIGLVRYFLNGRLKAVQESIKKGEITDDVREVLGILSAFQEEWSRINARIFGIEEPRFDAHKIQQVFYDYDTIRTLLLNDKLSIVAPLLPPDVLQKHLKAHWINIASDQYGLGSDKKQEMKIIESMLSLGSGAVVNFVQPVIKGLIKKPHLLQMVKRCMKIDYPTLFSTMELYKINISQKGQYEQRVDVWLIHEHMRESFCASIEEIERCIFTCEPLCAHGVGSELVNNFCRYSGYGDDDCPPTISKMIADNIVKIFFKGKSSARFNSSEVDRYNASLKAWVGTHLDCKKDAELIRAIVRTQLGSIKSDDSEDTVSGRMVFAEVSVDAWLDVVLFDIEYNKGRVLKHLLRAPDKVLKPHKDTIFEKVKDVLIRPGRNPLCDSAVQEVLDQGFDVSQIENLATSQLGLLWQDFRRLIVDGVPKEELMLWLEKNNSTWLKVRGGHRRSTTLMELVKDSKFDAAIALVEHEKYKPFLDINAEDIHGNSVFSYACELNADKMMTALLNNGVGIFRGLYIYAKAGNTDIIKKLLAGRNASRHIDLNAGDANGSTALHHAVMGSHIEMIKVLLEFSPALQFMKNKKGHTAFSCVFQCPDIEKQIKMTQALTNGKSFDLILAMKMTGSTAAYVTGLMEVMPNTIIIDSVDDDGKTALHYAVENADIKMIKALLRFGAGFLKDRKGQLAEDIKFSLFSRKKNLLAVAIDELKKEEEEIRASWSCHLSQMIMDDKILDELIEYVREIHQQVVRHQGCLDSGAYIRRKLLFATYDLLLQKGRTGTDLRSDHVSKFAMDNYFKLVFELSERVESIPELSVDERKYLLMSRFLFLIFEIMHTKAQVISTPDDAQIKDRLRTCQQEVDDVLDQFKTCRITHDDIETHVGDYETGSLIYRLSLFFKKEALERTDDAYYVVDCLAQAQIEMDRQQFLLPFFSRIQWQNKLWRRVYDGRIVEGKRYSAAHEKYCSAIEFAKKMEIEQNPPEEALMLRGASWEAYTPSHLRKAVYVYEKFIEGVRTACNELAVVMNFRRHYAYVEWNADRQRVLLKDADKATVKVLSECYKALNDLSPRIDRKQFQSNAEKATRIASSVILSMKQQWDEQQDKYEKIACQVGTIIEKYATLEEHDSSEGFFKKKTRIRQFIDAIDVVFVAMKRFSSDSLLSIVDVSDDNGIVESWADLGTSRSCFILAESEWLAGPRHSRHRLLESWRSAFEEKGGHIADLSSCFETIKGPIVALEGKVRGQADKRHQNSALQVEIIRCNAAIRACCEKKPKDLFFCSSIVDRHHMLEIKFSQPKFFAVKNPGSSCKKLREITYDAEFCSSLEPAVTEAHKQGLTDLVTMLCEESKRMDEVVQCRETLSQLLNEWQEDYLNSVYVREPLLSKDKKKWETLKNLYFDPNRLRSSDDIETLQQTIENVKNDLAQSREARRVKLEKRAKAKNAKAAENAALAITREAEKEAKAKEVASKDAQLEELGERVKGLNLAIPRLNRIISKGAGGGPSASRVLIDANDNLRKRINGFGLFKFKKSQPHALARLDFSLDYCQSEYKEMRQLADVQAAVTQLSTLLEEETTVLEEIIAASNLAQKKQALEDVIALINDGLRNLKKPMPSQELQANETNLALLASSSSLPTSAAVEKRLSEFREKIGCRQASADDISNEQIDGKSEEEYDDLKTEAAEILTDVVAINKTVEQAEAAKLEDEVRRAEAAEKARATEAERTAKAASAAAEAAAARLAEEQAAQETAALADRQQAVEPVVDQINQTLSKLTDLIGSDGESDEWVVENILLPIDKIKIALRGDFSPHTKRITCQPVFFEDGVCVVVAQDQLVDVNRLLQEVVDRSSSLRKETIAAYQDSITTAVFLTDRWKSFPALKTKEEGQYQTIQKEIHEFKRNASNKGKSLKDRRTEIACLQSLTDELNAVMSCSDKEIKRQKSDIKKARTGVEENMKQVADALQPYAHDSDFTPYSQQADQLKADQSSRLSLPSDQDDALSFWMRCQTESTTLLSRVSEHAKKKEEAKAATEREEAEAGRLAAEKVRRVKQHKEHIVALQEQCKSHYKKINEGDPQRSSRYQATHDACCIVFSSSDAHDLKALQAMEDDLRDFEARLVAAERQVKKELGDKKQAVSGVMKTIENTIKELEEQPEHDSQYMLLHDQRENDTIGWWTERLAAMQGHLETVQAKLIHKTSKDAKEKERAVLGLQEKINDLNTAVAEINDCLMKTTTGARLGIKMVSGYTKLRRSLDPEKKGFLGSFFSAQSKDTPRKLLVIKVSAAVDKMQQMQRGKVHEVSGTVSTFIGTLVRKTEEVKAHQQACDIQAVQEEIRAKRDVIKAEYSEINWKSAHVDRLLQEASSIEGCLDESNGLLARVNQCADVVRIKGLKGKIAEISQRLENDDPTVAEQAKIEVLKKRAKSVKSLNLALPEKVKYCDELYADFEKLSTQFVENSKIKVQIEERRHMIKALEKSFASKEETRKQIGEIQARLTALKKGLEQSSVVGEFTVSLEAYSALCQRVEAFPLQRQDSSGPGSQGGGPGHVADTHSPERFFAVAGTNSRDSIKLPLNDLRDAVSAYYRQKVTHEDIDCIETIVKTINEIPMSDGRKRINSTIKTVFDRYISVQKAAVVSGARCVVEGEVSAGLRAHLKAALETYSPELCRKICQASRQIGSKVKTDMPFP